MRAYRNKIIHGKRNCSKKPVSHVKLGLGPNEQAPHRKIKKKKKGVKPSPHNKCDVSKSKVSWNYKYIAFRNSSVEPPNTNSK